MNTIIKSINDPDCDTRMVPKWIECIVCRGKCVVTRDLPIRPGSDVTAPMEYECRNCSGTGETQIEVCNNCQQTEKECHCLDTEREQGRRVAA